MRISGFTTTRPNMPSTRTAEDFIKFLGEKPARLGIVSSLYEQYSASHLTEALLNTYSLDKAKKNQFQSIDSFVVEWDVKVNRIKRVEIIRSEGTGENAGDVIFHFSENYYQKYDTFIVEKTRQMFIVMNRPQRVADKDFMVIAKINDSSYDSRVDDGGVGGAEPNLAGYTTRFITNYMPEMHEEGYTKYQSNCEKHRTFIATHRADVDVSAMYKPLEQVFIQIGKGEKDDPVYEMNTAQKDCLDTFMMARNQDLVWGKANVDEYGKPKIYEDETGRPIVSGDGIVAQIERFASKFVFSKLNVKYFRKAIAAMVTKCEKATGNHFVFICNTIMWDEIQNTLSSWIRDWKTTGTFLFSKASNGYVDLGATYQSYEVAGNTLSFKVDRSLDVEYPTRKFGMMIDLSADSASGKPAIAMFTFKGGQFIQNSILGVGGLSGLASGEVSSRVAASKYIYWGYSGVGVFNPYRSVILISEEVRNPLF